MIHQKCAICEKSNYTILYQANFDPKTVDEKIFSARRLPDRIHYRIVKCKTCGLVYSNPILEYSKIEKLYKKSFVSYDDQVENLKETYGYYLLQLKKQVARAGGPPTAEGLLKVEDWGKARDGICLDWAFKSDTRLLEIGCGNGFFLEEALNQGYNQVWGVEPGVASVKKASKEIRKNIIVDIFKRGQFKKNFFDCIVCFQTLDHVPNPNMVISECHKILKKGGLVLFLNHDVESLSARILKETSPIIDIEHTYLLSKKTMRQIFEKNRFKVLEVGEASNTHNLAYWIHLSPIQKNLKRGIINLLKLFHLDKLKLKLNPGNLYLIAQK